VLETLDVADTRAGCAKRIDDVGIPRVRIVELNRELSPSARASRTNPSERTAPT